MGKGVGKQAGLPVIHERAAGIDIGSRFHVVAVAPHLSDEPVQTFQAFTADLQRMADWLVATGVKTVAMESTGVYWVPAFEVLESRKWRRKFVHTTNSRHDLPVAPNVLRRRFTPEEPNTAWVSDLTYIRTRSGWLYLAAVMDLYSRKIVGWAMAPSMPAQLVCDALGMAIASRRPAPGLIVHSDQGSQYASAEHTRLLDRHGLIASMSRKGNCWDNAVMERFFLNLKMERVWQRAYANHAEARLDIADYIVGFYNSIRLHSTLGYRSPMEFELQAEKLDT